MEPYVLGVDVWEGQLEIDEAALKLGGVEFIIVRLNDINGGHHKDEGFDKQWAEAARFLRWPYFVYNPWVSGEQNFDWLRVNMPSDARHVMIDVEVQKPGYSPVEYGKQLAEFLALVGRHWSFDVYTGGGYRHILTPWPSDVRYVWARYPYSFYPSRRAFITFDELHRRIRATAWNPGLAPGPCRMWQISGDRLILPGMVRAVDIVLYNGTRGELAAHVGQEAGGEVETWAEALTAWARGRGYTGPGPGPGENC